MAYPLRFIDLTFAALFTVAVFCQLSFVMRDNERVFRSLHAYQFLSTPDGHPIGGPPSSYFSIDWLVHPKHEHNRDDSFQMVLPDPSVNGSCYSTGMSWANADCGPQYWQTAEFCPPKNRVGSSLKDVQDALVPMTGAVTSQRYKDVLSQIYSADSDHHKLVQKMFVQNAVPTAHLKWPNPNMGDVCRMERISQMALVMNDDSSWGLSSAHSASVLLLGAALVMWLANITDVVYNPKFMKTDLSVFVKNSKWVVVTIAAAIVVVARVFSNSELTIAGSLMSRALPNGSYYYVFVSVLASGYILVNKTKAEEELGPATVVERDGLLPAPVPTIPTVLPTVPVKAGLDVSGFHSNKTQLNAYMPRSAPAAGSSMTVMAEEAYNPATALTYATFKDKNFDLQSSHFCVTQAFVLPLLTAAVYLVPANYDTDTNFQVLFWAAVAYGAIDIVVYRLTRVLEIYGVLMHSGASTKLETGLNLDTTEVVETGKVIDVLALVLQTLIGVIVFSCMRWHLALGTRQMVPVLGNESMTERFLDYAPVLYILYFTITNLTKTCALLHLLRPAESSQPGRLSSFYDSVVRVVGSQSSHVLFLTLNIFVAFVLLLLCLEMRKTEYTSPFPSITDATIKAVVDRMVHEYRGGWSRLDV